MTPPQPPLTQEQEALLAEVLEVAQLFEQKAKELSEQGDNFAQKWEKRLRDAEVAEVAVVPKSGN